VNTTNSFVRPEFSGEMERVAMTFLANTDALIIDLPNCSGGSADMVVFLVSYFFGDEPFHAKAPSLPSKASLLFFSIISANIEVPATQALKQAHLEALNKKLQRDPGQKEQLDVIIQGLKKELEAMTPRR